MKSTGSRFETVTLIIFFDFLLVFLGYMSLLVVKKLTAEEGNAFCVWLFEHLSFENVFSASFMIPASGLFLLFFDFE
jgi:hypothetical protein